MRQVTQDEFDQFLSEFSEGGVHAIERQRHDDVIGTGVMTVVSNPDVGLLGEIHHDVGIRAGNGVADVFLLTL